MLHNPPGNIFDAHRSVARCSFGNVIAIVGADCNQSVSSFPSPHESLAADDDSFLAR